MADNGFSLENLISGLYEVILRRSCRPDELAHWVAAFSKKSFSDGLRQFLSGEEIRKKYYWDPAALQSMIGGLISQSQLDVYLFDEDRVMLKKIYHGSDFFNCLNSSQIADVDRLYDFYVKGRNFRTVLDIGANTGYFACSMSKWSEKVYSFEPHPTNFKFLLQNMLIQGRENVEPIQKAVSDKEGLANLFIKERMGWHSLGTCNPEKYEMVKVDTTTVDSFVKEKGLTLVDLIKIDVEGHELKVLRGAQKAISEGKVAEIIFEVNRPALSENETKLEDIINFIKERGFEFFLDDERISPEDAMKAPDNSDLLAKRL